MSTTTAPAIVCPHWCETEPEVHVADLPEWEGHVLHRGRTYSTVDRYVEVYAWAWPDGTLDMTEPPQVHVLSHSDDGQLPMDALLFAECIAKATRWAQKVTDAGRVDSLTA